MTNKLALNWHTFNDHLLDNMKHLLSSNQYADVTLVCDDNIHLKAHSFVLSSCSSVFSNLFNGDSQSNATVFLKGIHHRDLDQILKFMYHGKATISEDRVNSFIAASKSLEVKEISTGFEDKNEEDFTPSEDNQEIRKELVTDNNTDLHIRKSLEQYSVQNITPAQPKNAEQTKCVKNSTRSNACPDCGRVFYDSSNMKKHYISKHQGVTFPCSQCDKVYSFQQLLTEHIQGVHDGQNIKCDFEDCHKEFIRKQSYNHHVKVVHKNVSYHCSDCDFETVNKFYLKAHIQSQHEGIRFECNECGKHFISKKRLVHHYRFVHDGITQKCGEENCNMEFANKQSLNKHTDAVHNNIRYSCPECDYQGTSKGNLKYHMQSKHEGIRYECSECGKHFTLKSHLRRHFQTVHE